MKGEKHNRHSSQFSFILSLLSHCLACTVETGGGGVNISAGTNQCSDVIPPPPSEAPLFALWRPLPIKQDILTQWWFNVGPPSTTLAHWTIIERLLRAAQPSIYKPPLTYYLFKSVYPFFTCSILYGCSITRAIVPHCYNTTWRSGVGNPLWLRGSVLGLRPLGFAFRILCLEGSVISPSSWGSPGTV